MTLNFRRTSENTIVLKKADTFMYCNNWATGTMIKLPKNKINAAELYKERQDILEETDWSTIKKMNIQDPGEYEREHFDVDGSYPMTQEVRQAKVFLEIKERIDQ